MNDPIVDEVRRIRDDHAARFHHDLDAIFHDLKNQEKIGKRKLVSYPPRRTESGDTAKTSQPSSAR